MPHGAYGEGGRNIECRSERIKERGEGEKKNIWILETVANLPAQQCSPSCIMEYVHGFVAATSIECQSEKINGRGEESEDRGRKIEEGRWTRDEGRGTMEGISNIEQGISNVEVKR